MGVAQRLKDLREAAGLSQAELARETGLTRKSIINYENAIVSQIPRQWPLWSVISMLVVNFSVGISTHNALWMVPMKSIHLLMG